MGKEKGAASVKEFQDLSALKFSTTG